MGGYAGWSGRGCWACGDECLRAECCVGGGGVVYGGADGGGGAGLAGEGQVPDQT